MLIQTDINELGDKRLDPKETVVKLREEAINDTVRCRIDGQDELEQAERSAGPRMFYTEIISRIREVNPSLQVIDGSPGNVAIYVRKKPTDISFGDIDPKGEFFTDHKYVGGMAKDWLPEYSHVILDSSLLPVREYRGWRTVLISLIRGGALTYNQAIAQFGEPRDARSTRWHQLLHKFKQNPNTLGPIGED